MIVITGASDGLGKAIAELYVAEGKRVISLSRGVPSTGVEHLKTDLQDIDSVNNASLKIIEDPDQLEILINCAGVLSIEKIGQLTTAEVSKVLDINVRAPLLLTSKLINKIKKDSADIVNISSTVGTKAYADQAAYGTSKWALRGFSRNLQLELKGSNSRVISFCPGGFQSDIFKKATGTDNMHDLGEWMTTLEVAKFMKQLLDLPKNMEVSEVVLNRK